MVELCARSSEDAKLRNFDTEPVPQPRSKDGAVTPDAGTAHILEAEKHERPAAVRVADSLKVGSPLGNGLASTVQRLAELRNAVGTGQGAQSSSDVPARDARIAASAAVAVSEFLLNVT